MSLESTALAMLIALPGATPEYAGEIADATVEAADGDKLLLAELLAIGFYESGFMSRIQAGQCRKHECDQGRARTFWQFQRTKFSRDAWGTCVGLEQEAILEASKVAASVLTAGRNACRSVEGTLSYYATGHCQWSGARQRAKLVRRLLAVQ